MERYWISFGQLELLRDYSEQENITSSKELIKDILDSQSLEDYDG